MGPPYFMLAVSRVEDSWDGFACAAPSLTACALSRRVPHFFFFSYHVRVYSHRRALLRRLCKVLALSLWHTHVQREWDSNVAAIAAALEGECRLNSGSDLRLLELKSLTCRIRERVRQEEMHRN